MNIDFADQVWWYTSRAAGIVAWVLLSLSVLAGLIISTRTAALPKLWRIDLHRFFSTLSLVFLAVHMAALVPDNFVYFAWAEIFVPFASEWQPGAVAWGVVAMWLMVAVEITSLLRNRIPHRFWRAVHFSSFAVWVGATIHLFQAGTDARHLWFRIAQLVLCSAVIIMTGNRLRIQVLRKSQPPGSARRRPLPIEKTVDIDQINAREGREFAA